MARLYMFGLQFAATLITNVIGLAATPGAPIDDSELAPPLVNLIMITATTVIFAANLHHAMLRALFDSYFAISIGSPLDPGWYLDQMVSKLSLTWSMGLRLAAPFVVFSVIVNLAIGFANKFTPMISVYFMTTGLTAALGLVLLFMIVDDMLGLFLQEILGFLD
jgi:flagellar biosynthetic protein FliR